LQNNLALEEIWNKGAWTEQARNIINSLKNSSFDSKTILILRHSQRYEPKLTEKNPNMELTSQGRSIARLFGSKLPLNKPIRLFHSPVNRCKETAEEIHAGFSEIGGKSIFKGECTAVWGIGANKQFFISELQKYRDIEVFFRWASGFYTIEEFPSLILYCQKGAEVIWNQLKLAPENSIDIYISHDFHLTAFRLGWFGLPPDDRWVNYLGGFAFTFKKNQILLSDYGEIKTVDVPHWWKKVEKK